MRLFLIPTALCALAAPSLASVNGRPYQSLADLVIGEPQLETLETAVRAAGLLEALQGEGSLTLLAPTNEAFAALDPHVLADLLEPQNKAALRSILLYHVLPQRVEYGEFAEREQYSTLNGQRVRIGRGPESLTVEGAGFKTINFVAENGYAQLIDRVLLPSDKDIVELASETGTFQTLLAAAKAAGLVDALQGPDAITLLAPTDEAFAKLGKETIDSLLEPKNKSELARILKYHVIPGRIFANEAIKAGSASTLAGDALRFSIRSGRLFAGDAALIETDLDATNGVVHVISSVLLPPAPPAPAGTLVIGYNSSRPGEALAAQLGIDRDSAVVVSAVTRPASGLERFDVITQVNGQPYSQDRITKAKKSAGYGGTVHLTVIRKGRTMQLDAPVDADPH